MAPNKTSVGFVRHLTLSTREFSADDIDVHVADKFSTISKCQVIGVLFGF